MTQAEGSLPIFDVQRVQLRFDISANFVAAQVANNVLILALSSGRILRFDLDNAEDIDDIDLPKRPAEIGVIRKIFMDPSASHLIISTSLGENFYLHTQSRQPKVLSRLKGVQIECIAWNPALPTASTREILIGANDGNIYEAYIESSTEFYRREEKYVKNVYKSSDGAITGIWVDAAQNQPDLRRVIYATAQHLVHYHVRVTRTGGEVSSAYTKLFESETPLTKTALDSSSQSTVSVLAISPDSSQHASSSVQHTFGWLAAQSVVVGELSDPADITLASNAFKQATAFPRAAFGTSQQGDKAPKESIRAIALSQFHVLAMIGNKLVAINRLDASVVYDERVLDASQTLLGLYIDQQKNTYWLLTDRDIFEIVATDETRDVWQMMLRQNKFDLASQYASTPAQKDSVAQASADHLIAAGRHKEAALVYGRSSKSFEVVALSFMDSGESDALRTYLLTRLSYFKKASNMQRAMIAAWLVELYMARLNELDDKLATLADDTGRTTVQKPQTSLADTRNEFVAFVEKHKSDLDQKTVYEIIGSHGREEELLRYASVIEDNAYVLGYWIQRENWSEAINVLKKQTDLNLFYRYSNVLMEHSPLDFVEILLRQEGLDESRLIPALLNYSNANNVPLSQNQAVRFLNVCINKQSSQAASIHNTLVSIYASNRSKDESALLAYLEAQDTAHVQYYDADFALRLCINHGRIKSTVRIYCAMRQYAAAVDTALKHDQIDLAADVADRPDNDMALRKRLWLKIAKKVMAKSEGISSAIEFLKRCEFLRIEDLIPLFPDFIVIDDFKAEICQALEEYSRQIDELRLDMDRSADTAKNIQNDIKALDRRYAIVEPGERCWQCRLPLLMRQFFVFPCQHSFHADCLAKSVIRMSPTSKGRRIEDLQAEIGQGLSTGKKKERLVRELDSLVAGQCILCGDVAVKHIDEPFVSAGEETTQWDI